jgi:hypothetical protein
MQQELEQQSGRPETAREAAKSFIQPYVLDGWTLQEISKKQPSTDRDEFAARVGGGKVTDHRGEPHPVSREQVAVTRVGAAPCWGLFDLGHIMAEIRDERRGYAQMSLAAIFAQQEEEREQPEQPTAKKHQRPAVYRSYNAGCCQNPACGAELGYIETEGGRDRLYCNDACRVAAHRAKKREEKRQQVLHYHAELREYWHLHGIRGEVLLRLQEILLQHGKAAARAATDAVLVACAAQEQAGSNEQVRLIDEVMSGGERIGFEEVRLAEFRIPQGVAGWSEFVTYASTNLLRQVRGYLYDREYQEEYKAKARQRLEQLSRETTQRPEQQSG